MSISIMNARGACPFCKHITKESEVALTEDNKVRLWFDCSKCEAAWSENYNLEFYSCEVFDEGKEEEEECPCEADEDDDDDLTEVYSQL